MICKKTVQIEKFPLRENEICISEIKIRSIQLFEHLANCPAFCPIKRDQRMFKFFLFILVHIKHVFNTAF